MELDDELRQQIAKALTRDERTKRLKLPPQIDPKSITPWRMRAIDPYPKRKPAQYERFRGTEHAPQEE